MVYLAITIGQLFTNRRALMAFIIYFGLNIAVITISELTGGNLTHNGISSEYLTFTTIESLIEGIIFYFATHYLLKNKINIQ